MSLRERINSIAEYTTRRIMAGFKLGAPSVKSSTFRIGMPSVTVAGIPVEVITGGINIQTDTDHYIAVSRTQYMTFSTYTQLPQTLVGEEVPVILTMPPNAAGAIEERKFVGRVKAIMQSDYVSITTSSTSPGPYRVAIELIDEKASKRVAVNYHGGRYFQEYAIHTGRSSGGSGTMYNRFTDLSPKPKFKSNIVHYRLSMDLHYIGGEDD